MPRRLHLAFLTLLFVAGMLAGARAGAAEAVESVLIVASELAGAHEETVKALRTAFAPEVPSTEIAAIRTGDVDDEALAQRRVIVTVGSEAARTVAALAPRTAVLHTLLPRDAYERLPSPGAARRSAIFLDQPVERQIALIVEALPEWRRLALLVGPQSRALATKLAAEARAQALEVSVENIASDREIYPALQRLLAERAVLLALPDSLVFNSYTIQNVLLTSYRHRSPLVGFSPAYVRAGALLGLYSTPRQIGQQAAEAVKAVLAGRELPRPQAPRLFEVGINQNVADSLGIQLDSAAAIAARVSRREAKP